MERKKKHRSLREEYPPSEPCSCEICKSYCVRPGWWTVEEAIKLGATKSAAQYGGEQFVTMLDPEGHPFCLCKKS
jgi:hypothetical protein